MTGVSDCEDAFVLAPQPAPTKITGSAVASARSPMKKVLRNCMPRTPKFLEAADRAGASNAERCSTKCKPSVIASYPFPIPFASYWAHCCAPQSRTRSPKGKRDQPFQVGWSDFRNANDKMSALIVESCRE